MAGSGATSLYYLLPDEAQQEAPGLLPLRRDWVELVESYNGQITGMVDDSADTQNTDNTTDMLNLKVDVYIFYRTIDNGRTKKLDWVNLMIYTRNIDDEEQLNFIDVEANQNVTNIMDSTFDVSGQRQKHYIWSDGGRPPCELPQDSETIHLHQHWCDHLRAHILLQQAGAVQWRCHKTRVGDEEREQDDDAEESEATGSTAPSTGTTPSSSWSRRRAEKHILFHLMKDSELDGDMLHSKWWMMTHGIRSRVKDTLIVYCDVLTNNTKDDGTNKTPELFFLQKLY